MTRAFFLSWMWLLAVPVLWAQGAGSKLVSDKKLSDFTIGEIISGDPAGEEELQGKVVVLEFWGRL